MSELSYSMDSLQEWFNSFKFSKKIRVVNRDFSDGVLMAELLKQIYPQIVDLHNYSPKNSVASKLENWNHLNSKVFPKLKFKMNSQMMYNLATSKPDAIEKLLIKIKKTTDNVYTLNSSDSYFTDVIDDSTEESFLIDQSTTGHQSARRSQERNEPVKMDHSTPQGQITKTHQQLIHQSSKHLFQTPSLQSGIPSIQLPIQSLQSPMPSRQSPKPPCQSPKPPCQSAVRQSEVIKVRVKVGTKQWVEKLMTAEDISRELAKLFDQSQLIESLQKNINYSEVLLKQQDEKIKELLNNDLNSSMTRNAGHSDRFSGMERGDAGMASYNHHSKKKQSKLPTPKIHKK